ncbi:hypothetical protein OJAV_G00107690 [Oryzias javanicus]|uniref:Uncharacterized protein n=1 Tax=Oryzias javanicus TaxID=123683 RepID=A0A437CVI0_ORYJA|nr:hypothetical protein OJAV_G00107690 [Oryzias javanicus]
MDFSEEVQNISEEFIPPVELKKGMSIFIDILRRADKNDDGKLSSSTPLILTTQTIWTQMNSAIIFLSTWVNMRKFLLLWKT